MPGYPTVVTTDAANADRVNQFRTYASQLPDPAQPQIDADTKAYNDYVGKLGDVTLPTTSNTSPSSAAAASTSTAAPSYGPIDSSSHQAFVQSMTPYAQLWEQKTGIPASTWIAMGASESNWGKAGGNELFGIKGGGNAGSLNSPTWESVNGKRVNINDNFAAYQTPNDAFQGFWDLVQGQRYAPAMAVLRNGGSGYDFVRAINNAGYATDPNWAESIRSIAQNQIEPLIGTSAPRGAQAPYPQGLGDQNGSQSAAAPAASGVVSQASAYSGLSSDGGVGAGTGSLGIQPAPPLRGSETGQPPSPNDDLKEFSAYASSLGDPGGTSSFGSNPEDASSPIDQARSQGQTGVPDFAGMASSALGTVGGMVSSMLPKPTDQGFSLPSSSDAGPQPYNDMAGASSSPLPAFGANPEDATSPIEQNRVSNPPVEASPFTLDWPSVTVPTNKKKPAPMPQLLAGEQPLTDLGNQIVQGERNRLANQSAFLTPTLGTRADQPAREQVTPTAPGRFDLRAGYTPSQQAEQQSSAANIAMGSTGIEKVGAPVPRNLLDQGISTLYHETSPGDAVLMATSLPDSQGLHGLNVSPVKDLALGQGGKGAIVEIGNTHQIQARPLVSKPGMDFVNSQLGKPAELEISNTAPATAIKSITFTPGAAVPKWAPSRLRNMGWTITRDAEGVHAANPNFVDAAPPPLSTASVSSPPAVGGAIVGGLAGATQGNTPEERARNALLGAAAGGVGGHLLGSGQLGRLAREDAGTVNLGGILDAGKSAAKAVNELIAPAKNTPPQVQAALKDFANRNLEGAVQAETIGLRAKKVLGPLDTADTAGFFESTSQLHPSQTPEQAAFAREVHDYMETTKVEGKAHGYIQGDVVNGPNAQVSSYFPHIYQENLTRATAQARKGGLNPNDFYSNSRTFPTLSDAQAAGFNPVDSFSGPLQHYVGRVASSEAKYQLVERLKNAGPPAAIPYTAGMKLPDGWVAGSSTVPQFAKYAFPEPVARAINNIVGSSGMRSTMIGRGFLNAQSLGKELLFTLSGFHNVTELRQAVNANGFKGVPIVGKTLENGFVPGAWDAFRLKEADGLALAARAGVTGLAGSEKALDVGSTGLSPAASMALRSGAGALSGAASGYGIGAASGADDQTKLKLAMIGALGGAAAGPLMKPIADALWERQVPTLKYLTWKTQVGLGRDPEAAAKFVNNTYGGQNLAAIARSKTVQDVARTFLLAPDWWESWSRQIGNVAAKGDTGAMARQYWARTAVVSAFTLEGLNYAFNHHFTNENDPDHANQVEVTGLYKQLGIDRRDPKTGVPIREYMSVLPAPVESLLTLATGGPQGAARFAMGRVSTPVRAGIQALTNTNYRGQQINPPYTPPLEQAKNLAANTLSQIAPVGVQQAETSAAGGEPASIAGLSTALGLRTSQAAKSTYAGPQLSQKSYDILNQSGIGDWRPTPIGDSITGFGLTRDERTRYQGLVDTQRDAALVKLSQKPAWQKLSAPDKKQLLDDIMRSIDDSASTQVLRSIPKDELKKRQTVATAAAH